MEMKQLSKYLNSKSQWNEPTALSINMTYTEVLLFLQRKSFEIVEDDELDWEAYKNILYKLVKTKSGNIVIVSDSLKTIRFFSVYNKKVVNKEFYYIEFDDKTNVISLIDIEESDKMMAKTLGKTDTELLDKINKRFGWK